MERRFGFREIRSLQAGSGQEQFGLIDLDGGGHAAVLALRGRAGSPPLPAAAQTLLDHLADALPECGVQFLVSRRRVAGAALLGRWRAAITQRLGETSAARRVWRDLYDGYWPRLEEAGLADLWCGVAVAAATPDQLIGRVAGLYTRLPYEAAPLGADDLQSLLGRLLRPGETAGTGRPFPVGGGRLLDLPGLLPRALLIGPDTVALAPATVTSYWQITPPLARADGGWISRLLQLPDLWPHAYDLAIHLRPASTEQTMRAVLDGRLLRLEEELRRRGGAPLGPPPAAAPAAAAESWLLELERREVLERRAGLTQGRDRLREAVILLALHLPAAPSTGGRADREAGAPALSRAFAATLAAAAVPARPLQGRALLGRAVRATLPLVNAEGLRPFALPARQAAELVLLPPVPAVVPGAPILGLTRERGLFAEAPAGPRTGHRVLAGGGAPARRAAARQWALHDYLAGADLCLWDAAGAWAGWVAALGGRYVRPGGPLPADHLNLLAAPLAALDRPEFFDAWVRELAGLFGHLLPPITGQDLDAVRSQVGAALLQLGMRSLERADPATLSLDALYAELRAGGYRASAEGLEKLAGGPAGRLLGTSLTATPPPGLVAIGPPEGLGTKPGRLAAGIAYRHALWPETPLLGPARTAARRVALVDGISEALRHAYLAADLLALVSGPPGPVALWLLPTDDELAPLLGHPAGRALLRSLPLYALFGPAAGMAPGLTAPPSAPGLDALIALAGVPAPAAAHLPLLAPDQALIQVAGQPWVLEIPTGPLADA